MGLMLGLVPRVPLWAWALVALLAWGGWNRFQAVRATDRLATATVQAKIASAQAEAAAAAETTRRVQAQQEVINAQSRRTARAQADAATATAAGQRLRDRLAAMQADRARDTAAADAGAAANDPIGVLADVLGRCSARHRSVAQYADTARDAGIACQQSYDALGKPAK